MTKIITKKIKGNNRHWKNFLDKNYLGAHNLEQGEELLVTIERFEGEEVVQSKENGKQKKPVLYFKEEVPKLILNITNGNTIAALYGSHPEAWIGKQIQLHAAPITAFKKQMEAIRIRDFAPRIEVDATQFITNLETATTLEELKNVFTSLPVSAQKNPQVVAKKDALKAQLSK